MCRFILHSDDWKGLFTSKKFCTCYNIHFMGEKNLNTLNIYPIQNELHYHRIYLINETQNINYCFLSQSLHNQVTARIQGYYSFQSNFPKCSWPSASAAGNAFQGNYKHNSSIYRTRHCNRIIFFGISKVTVKSCNSGGPSVVGKDQLFLGVENNFAVELSEEWHFFFHCTQR